MLRFELSAQPFGVLLLCVASQSVEIASDHF
jgi:hypothetical protein